MKPANILMANNGVKLLDFGLAKRQPKTRAAASPDETAIPGVGPEGSAAATPMTVVINWQAGLK